MSRIRAAGANLARRLHRVRENRSFRRLLDREVDAARARAGDAPVRVLVQHRAGEATWPAYVARRPGTRVIAVPKNADPDEQHLRLTAEGPFDVVVDAVPGVHRRLRRFVDTFYQLRAGGVYVLRGGAVELGPRRERLGAMLARAEATRGTPAPGPYRRTAASRREAHALGRAAGAWSAVGDHLVVPNVQGDALAKLRDPELAPLLARRPDLPVRVLDTIPAESFVSHATFHELGHAVRTPPSSYDAPEAALREYDEPLVVPGQIVVLDRALMPDTFRHWQRPRLVNIHLDEQALRFARLPDHPEPVHLPGRYYHLDNEHRGHFGHLMTESVSRVWGWEQSKAADPDLKLLVCTNLRAEIQPYEYTLYAAAGIDRDDVVLVDAPVRVDQLVSAAPLFSNPHFVHPRITETWRRVGDRLAARAVGGPRPQRFFCSRRIHKRACRNTGEVEALFAAHGFEIVFPEDYSLGDQVEMFRGAEVVAGFAGSGLFNLCFVERPVQVVSLRSESYTASNEYLMGALHGHRFLSVVSRADRPGHFQSPWSVDFEREGRELAGFLADLPG